MKKVMLLFVLLILGTSFVAASAANTGELLGDLDRYNGVRLPDSIQKVFSSADIHIHVTMASGDEELVTVSVQSGIISAVGREALERHDLDIYLSEAQIDEILSSEDSLKTIEASLESGAISYSANGLWNKIKYAFVRLFTGTRSGETPTDDVEDIEEVEEEEAEESEVEELEEVDEVEDETEEVEDDSSDDVEESDDAEVEEETDDDLEEELEEVEDVEEILPEGEHIINMDFDGFDPVTLTVNLGDKVTFVNTREGENIELAMVVGTRLHRDLRSDVLEAGETYEWTFTETGEYVIVDGILTTLAPLEITVVE